MIDRLMVLRIRSLALLTVGFLIAIGILGVVNLIVVSNDVEVIHETWAEVDGAVAVEGSYLESLQKGLGAGSIAVQYKNLILNPDSNRALAIQAAGKDLLANVDAYLDIVAEEDERTALREVQYVLNAYLEAAARVETLAREGRSPAEIEKLIAFDEGPAMAAMGFLEEIQEKERVEAGERLSGAATNTEDTVFLIGYINIGMIAVGALVLGAILIRLANSISEITEIQTRLAGGDMDAEVPVFENPPEVAELCVAMAKFKDESLAADKYRVEQDAVRIETEREQRRAVLGLADNFENAVGSVIDTLSSSVSELSATASEVTNIASRTAERSVRVRDSATEAGQDIESVTDSVNEVNKAVEEVALKVTETSGLTNSAARQAADAAEKVAVLDAASARINDIVSLIADIAAQTNLLALNATIEAARAGESGKGFAVVANEVKSLAAQTQRATEEIGAHVSNMLSEIAASTAAVKSITVVVDKTDATMTSIAGAVEEQAATTGEVARAAQAALERIRLVVDEISAVAEDATATGSATEELHASAGELGRSSDILTRETSNFITHIRSDNEQGEASA